MLKSQISKSGFDGKQKNKNTTKVIITAITVTVVTLLSLSSCKDGITDPNNNIKPGRRDYTWTADTLKADDSFDITQLWGSSPDDIWAVASGTSYKDCLWHYDGVMWTKSTQWISSNLYAVFGFNSTDIWAGDGENIIWNYDGKSWSKFKNLSVAGYNVVSISDIFGIAENDLYAVGGADKYDGSGYKGVILKFDGTKWNYLNIPDMRVGFNYIKKANDGNYIVTATNYDNGFLDKVFVFDGVDKFKEIYSDYHWPGLWEMNGNVYVNVNDKIYKYHDKSLFLWKNFSSEGYYGTVLGRNEKDFFGVGNDGIMHYNGSDLVTLYNTQFDHFKGQLIFDKDVFFWGYIDNTETNVIIRGTLKDN